VIHPKCFFLEEGEKRQKSLEIIEQLLITKCDAVEREYIRKTKSLNKSVTKYSNGIVVSTMNVAHNVSFSNVSFRRIRRERNESPKEKVLTESMLSILGVLYAAQSLTGLTLNILHTPSI
jgi:hypothetical protein